MVDGKKTRVNTFLSHDGRDYGKSLMSSIKKQLCFDDPDKMEKYFDCTFSEVSYIEMLSSNGKL